MTPDRFVIETRAVFATAAIRSERRRFQPRGNGRQGEAARPLRALSVTRM